MTGEYKVDEDEARYERLAEGLRQALKSFDAETGGCDAEWEKTCTCQWCTFVRSIRAAVGD